LQANAESAPRLIRFLAGVSPDEAAPVIRRILSAPVDDHLISTCLQVMSQAEDLDLVRPLLTHSRWHVRMQAAATLGRIGQAGDEQLLLPLLSDEQWWVRYRAAQALTKLPSIGEKDVLRIRNAQSDRFACDILDQVMAEQKIGVNQ
jgi:HEAT repeat protein